MYLYMYIYVCVYLCSVLFRWRLRRATTSPENVRIRIRDGMISAMYLYICTFIYVYR